MNNEYLWQKTGEDPEIEKLEKALSQFRYREDAPPALPVITEARKSWKRRFAIAFATPAFAAVAIVTAIWLMPNDDAEVTFIHEPPPSTADVVRPSEVKPIDMRPVAKPRQPASHRNITVQSASMRVRRRPVEKTRVPKSTEVALTDEERYAYRQLMIALSISSSKLKVVKNAINGIDEEEIYPQQNNR